LRFEIFASFVAIETWRRSCGRPPAGSWSRSDGEIGGPDDLGPEVIRDTSLSLAPVILFPVS
jgi:hypothetical protein